MEILKMQMLAVLASLVDNQPTIRNQQIVRDMGSMIYRIFPTEDVLVEIEKAFKASPNIESASSVREIGNNETEQPVWKVYQGRNSSKDKKKPIINKDVAAIEEIEEIENAPIETLTDYDVAHDTGLYQTLLEKDEDEVIKYFGSLAATKTFGKEKFGLSFAANEKATSTVAKIFEKMVEQI